MDFSCPQTCWVFFKPDVGYYLSTSEPIWTHFSPRSLCSPSSYLLIISLSSFSYFYIQILLDNNLLRFLLVFGIISCIVVFIYFFFGVWRCCVHILNIMAKLNGFLFRFTKRTLSDNKLYCLCVWSVTWESIIVLTYFRLIIYWEEANIVHMQFCVIVGLSSKYIFANCFFIIVKKKRNSALRGTRGNDLKFQIDFRKSIKD